MIMWSRTGPSSLPAWVLIRSSEIGVAGKRNQNGAAVVRRLEFFNVF